MKVVLATAPDEWATKEHLPPLSLGYIAAVLEEAGHEVSIVDSPAYPYTVEEAGERIADKKPDAVGITATTHNRLSAIKLCHQVKKETKALIITGGPHFALTARDAIQNVSSIDIVVRGEGEFATKEILDVYSEGKDLKSVPGIVYRDKGGEIIETVPRPFLTNLDTLPLAAWHLFNLKKYHATLEGEYKTPSIGVISSRGCPHQCTFCANRHFWQCTLRSRSPKNFVDELELLHKEYGYKGFDIWDDTLTISRKRVVEICEEITKRKLDIVWYARARVNTVDKDLLNLMRRSGCQVISYGVESGSESILRNIKKKITLVQVKEAIKVSAELGFNIKAFFMFSLPGENAQDIKATLRLIDELSTYGRKVRCIGVFTLIYPGTELEFLAKEQGTLPRDFQWNKPQVFEKNKLVRANLSIPLYENPDLPVEQILQILAVERSKLPRLLARGFRRLIQVRDINSLRVLLTEVKDTIAKKGRLQ